MLHIGEIFKYPVRYTWEFTSDHPIRSVFPLWPIYGLPMLLLRWLWVGNDDEVPPVVVFYTLRVLMFILSFVLEDWAIYELVQSPRHRRVAVLLVASSYATWSYQTHTFSNAIETLAVAWSLVLIGRTVMVPFNTVCQIVIDRPAGDDGRGGLTFASNIHLFWPLLFWDQWQCLVSSTG